MTLYSLACWIVFWCSLFLASTLVQGHGRLMDPPARNAMWRFGYPNPVNYNDNELFCGGYAVQWEQNDGRCGVCGDAYHVKSPRPHEAGGEYGKGIISRYYTAGQEIDVEVELTANHYGRFELLLCPNNNPRKEATQDCFNRYPLYISGSREHRYLIPRDAKKKDIFRYKVHLPPFVTCTQCVLQWTYYTANMWGKCANGTEAVGCGKAGEDFHILNIYENVFDEEFLETFRNCADIAIISNTGGGVPPIFVNNRANPYLLYYRDYRAPETRNVFPLVVRDQKCIAAPAFRIIPGMDYWCEINCLRYPPNCPESACYCPQECVAIGELAGKEGTDAYCMDACLNYGSDCPADKCRCF